ncbi:hypothetical protein ACWGVR_06100 [Streptomyces xanthophaeus]
MHEVAYRELELPVVQTVQLVDFVPQALRLDLLPACRLTAAPPGRRSGFGWSCGRDGAGSLAGPGAGGGLLPRCGVGRIGRLSV